MITLPALLVFAFAVSLPVTYMLIIHSSLSGGAANDPNFDVDAPAAKGSARRESDHRAYSGHGATSHA